MKPDYKKAYDILMDYFNDLHDEDKQIINEQLKEAGL